MRAIVKYHVSGLFCLAFLLNIYFLSVNFKNGFFPLPVVHGEVGYNFYKFNSIKSNSAISSYLESIHPRKPSSYGKNPALLDLSYAADQKWPCPHQFNPIFETVGYGLLLGLLWKVTHSLSYFDIQLLQIMLYSLLMLLVYHLAYLLFKSYTIAFCVGIMQLLYFPLIFLNVQVMRDIWPYYGLLALAWAIVYKLRFEKGWLLTILAIAFFGICQFIRPIGIPALGTMSLLLIVHGFYYHQWQKILKLLMVLWVVTGLFFWLPFMAYNKYAYGRYISGPTGQILMEGWGEFENPAHYEISDKWFVTYISEKYNTPIEKYGTPEFDDIARKEVIQTIKRYKWDYCLALIKRIPQVLMPALMWQDDPAVSPFANCKNIFEKIIKILTNLNVFIYFILYQRYMMFFFLLSYLGMLCLWKHRYYLPLAICFSVIASGQLMIISHFEARYQISFYWPMSFFAGYFLYYVGCWLKRFFYAKKIPHCSKNYIVFLTK